MALWALSATITFVLVPPIDVQVHLPVPPGWSASN